MCGNVLKGCAAPLMFQPITAADQDATRRRGLALQNLSVTLRRQQSSPSLAPDDHRIAKVRLALNVKTAILCAGGPFQWCVLLTDLLLPLLTLVCTLGCSKSSKRFSLHVPGGHESFEDKAAPPPFHSNVVGMVSDLREKTISGELL